MIGGEQCDRGSKSAGHTKFTKVCSILNKSIINPNPAGNENV